MHRVEVRLREEVAALPALTGVEWLPNQKPGAVFVSALVNREGEDALIASRVVRGFHRVHKSDEQVGS
jgi:hypothetical protein